MRSCFPRYLSIRRSHPVFVVALVVVVVFDTERVSRASRAILTRALSASSSLRARNGREMEHIREVLFSVCQHIAVLTCGVVESASIREEVTGMGEIRAANLEE